VSISRGAFQFPLMGDPGRVRRPKISIARRVRFSAELNLQAATTQRAPKRAEAPAGFKKVFDELQVSSNQSTTMGPSCCPSFRHRPGVQFSLSHARPKQPTRQKISALSAISPAFRQIFFHPAGV
jgi:hypothetical protein